MCVLPDHEILERVKNGELKIENYSDASLTPNGYDLRIAEVSVPGGPVVREGLGGHRSRLDVLHLHRGRGRAPVLVVRPAVAADLVDQKGLLAGLGKVDAGFRGTLTFMAVNVSPNPVEVPIGSRFVQMIFETLHSPAHLTYEKRSGNYQGQNGITLAPVNQADVRGEDAHRR